MSKKSIFAFLTVLSFLLNDPVSCSASCANSDCISNWRFCDDPCSWDLDVSIYGGYVYGKSKEIVYNNANSHLHFGKISQLEWEIKNLWVIGGMIRQSFFNRSFHFSLNGWTKGHAGNSMMIDRDFLDPVYSNLLTDISKSPNTKLQDAKTIDFLLGYDFYRFSLGSSSLSFTILGGYKYQEWDWKAYGGKFIYNYGQRVGSFPNVLVISYKQQFWIPYIGLKTEWQWNQYGLILFGQYTNKARITDHDFHPFRDATFTGRFKNGEYWVTGLEAKMNIWKCFDLNIGFTYQRLANTRGDSVHKERGFTIYNSHDVGVSHHHYLINLGLTAYF